MVKPSRTFIGIGIFFLVLAVFSAPVSLVLKGSAYSFLKAPLAFSKAITQTFVDLVYFKKNAGENRSLRRRAAQSEEARFRVRELELENERLAKLLEMKRTQGLGVKRALFAQVIARSPSPLSRVVFIDKGRRQGVRPNLLVLSDQAVIGKVVETGPSMSKVVLISDPNSRVGVLMQRTRYQGVLFGTSGGECRVKYLSLDAGINPGDIVETMGYGGFFPKGLRVGTVVKTWKEPGQIYQVAQVKPFADLTRIEEVVCVE
ncbi:MAG: rod shape-determining protein MreC [Candidatus Omnitrophica bacterium]|nr:rod shape-determining protein MreC [Candidatus Omnitrophota bacterium]